MQFKPGEFSRIPFQLHQRKILPVIVDFIHFLWKWDGEIQGAGIWSILGPMVIVIWNGINWILPILQSI